MIKLVAFDWNGTILSDLQPCLEANNLTFTAFGLKPLSLKKFQETFDVPIINLYIANGYSEAKYRKNSRQQAELYQKFYEEKTRNTRSRSGVRQSLAWLKKKGIGTVVYSNHLENEIKSGLRRLKLDGYVGGIIGRTMIDEHHKARSKGGKLHNYVKSLRLKPKEVLSVGDTCEEIEIGHSLGFYNVTLTGGWNSTKRLKACKPDFLIHNLKDLIPIIKRLNSND